MIVPAPPLKPVQVDDLLINKCYCTPSGLGGTYRLLYLGMIFDEHIFASKTDDWPGLHLPPDRVSSNIFEDHSLMTTDEYIAAGGKY